MKLHFHRNQVPTEDFPLVYFIDGCFVQLILANWSRVCLFEHIWIDIFKFCHSFLIKTANRSASRNRARTFKCQSSSSEGNKKFKKRLRLFLKNNSDFSLNYRQLQPNLKHHKSKYKKKPSANWRRV